jgi:hypothetical protein
MPASLDPVALISMPSLSARFPSFQLGLLKPTLERRGIPTQAFSLFMYFGSHVGWRINEALADVYPCMVGEWIWSRAAFGDFANDEEYLEIYDQSLRSICMQAHCTIADLRHMRGNSASFIGFCVSSVDWSRFGVIGFSVVFQQTLASIAKDRYPRFLSSSAAGLGDDIAED